MKHEYRVGDRVMDTLLKQKATVTKVIKSAILTDWTVACLVRYDHPPPMEYNMGSIEGVQFVGRLYPLHKEGTRSKERIEKHTTAGQ